MPTVTYNGASYSCTTAIKGDTYIRLLDAEDAILASFEGITDFSAFAISGGSWSSPEDLDQCCLVVMRSDGTLVKTTKKVCDVGNVTNLQSNKQAVTPSTSKQTIYPDAGYDAMTEVVVNAIPSAYVKPSYTREEAEWTPSTEYQYIYAKTYCKGQQTIKPIPSTYVKPSSTVGQQDWTPGTQDKTIPAGTYCSGAQIIKGDPNHLVENIKKGVSLFGKIGTYSGEWTCEVGTAEYQQYDSDTIVVPGITRADPAVLLVFSPDFVWDSSEEYDSPYITQMIYSRDYCVRGDYDRELHWAVYGIWGISDGYSDCLESGYTDSAYNMRISNNKLEITIKSGVNLEFVRQVDYVVFAFYDN